jgi:hypothetical protein
MAWWRGFAVWLLIIVVESIHGTLRQLLLAPVTGDLPARRVAVFTGLLLIFLVTLATIRWIGMRATKDLLMLGGLWVVLTLVFELVLGRAVFGYPWSRLLEDYDLTRGGLMSLGLLGMLGTPLLAARIGWRARQDSNL